MNNDLEQFSEERLKQLASGKYAGTGLGIQNREVAPLARIALSAKQAKPVGYVQPSGLKNLQHGVHDCIWPEVDFDDEDIAVYTTPQPAHTEQVITDNVRDALEKALNAMQFMGDTLNNLDAVCAEDVEHVTPAFEAIRKLLAAAPKPESE